MSTKEWYQIGNLSVPSTWLAFLLVAFLTAMLLWRLFGRNVSSVFMDYLFYFLITWKLSVVVTDFGMVVNNPLTILYYATGDIGVYFGVGVVLLLFVYRQFVKKNQAVSIGQIVEAYIVFLSLFSLFTLMLNQHALWEIGLVVFVWAIVWWMGFRSREAVIGRIVSFLLAYTLIHLLFGYELAGTTIVVYVLGLIIIGIELYKKNWDKQQLSMVVMSLLLSAIVWTVYDHVQKTEVDEELSVENEQVSKQAPNFTAKNLEGESVQLTDYEGMKVVLNFWATWCPPCKAEMPHMQKYYEEYAKKHNAEIVAVNLTSQDKGMQQINQFVNDYGLDFPVLLDEDGSISSQYKILTIPTTFILDEKGTIVEEIKGPLSKEHLIHLLAE